MSSTPADLGLSDYDCRGAQEIEPLSSSEPLRLQRLADVESATVAYSPPRAEQRYRGGAILPSEVPRRLPTSRRHLHRRLRRRRSDDRGAGFGFGGARVPADLALAGPAALALVDRADQRLAAATTPPTTEVLIR